MYVIEAAYNILGSLVLMFFYDAKVVMLCLAVLVPVVLTSKLYGKMKQLNRSKNDELENQVDVISHGNTRELKNIITAFVSGK